MALTERWPGLAYTFPAGRPVPRPDLENLRSFCAFQPDLTRSRAPSRADLPMLPSLKLSLKHQVVRLCSLLLKEQPSLYEDVTVTISVAMSPGFQKSPLPLLLETLRHSGCIAHGKWTSGTQEMRGVRVASGTSILF